MKGLGTDDNMLTRVMVSRSAVDMEDIKKTFLAEYGKTLYSFIKVRECHALQPLLCMHATRFDGSVAVYMKRHAFIGSHHSI